MGKKEPKEPQEPKVHRHTKANRFEALKEKQVLPDNRRTWPADAVVYIGHLPHGFYEEQLKSYFEQYGQVLAVKVARSRTTARSRGYAFVQFKYPEIAEIVSNTMNGYLLFGKVLVSNRLPLNADNPFHFSTARQYKFINWRHKFNQEVNKVKTQEQSAHVVETLLAKEEKRRERLKQLGFDYQFPGFSAAIRNSQKPLKSKKK